ncbi:MAG TPA: hypothetical protein VLG11_00640 [Candidatus Saccharimonadales bacterium]|nr:hypothetical protein [Candidatus Saccharimonadales bacterium]
MAVAAALPLFVTGTAWAAPSSVGVTVSPAVTNITLQSNQDTATFTSTLENDTAQPVVITPHASDFGVSGVNEVITLKTIDAQHGLAANLQFTPAKLTLPAGASQPLRITIRGGANLGPGGHFAAIRYQIAPLAGGAASSVDIKSELIGYVFLAAAGKSTYGVTLKTSLPGVALWRLPLEADLLFTNTGNTQTAPRGLVNIVGPLRTQVANGIINSNSSLVLPGSTRLLQTDLRQLRQPVWPGRYYVDVYYRAGEMENYQHMRTSFIFIGWPITVVAVIFAALALVLLRVVRRYFRRKRRPAQPVPTPTPARRTIPVKHL